MVAVERGSASRWALVGVLLCGSSAWASDVVVFDDPSYVDTGGSSSNESDTIQATLADQEHTVTTFTGTSQASWAAALAGKDVIVIPELEQGDLAPDLAAGAITEITNFVSGGRKLLLYGHGGGSHDLNVLNTVFGFTATSGSASGTASRTAAATGTRWASCPATISNLSATNRLDIDSLPVGAEAIYANGNQGWVVQIPYGSGEVIYFGWDWYNAQPLGSADGGWIEVLDKTVTYLFVVDTTDDTVDANVGDGLARDAGGKTSLRAAIMEANAQLQDYTISVPAGTYALTLAGAGEDAAASGDLDLTRSLTIQGDGAADAVVIDAGSLDRVMHLRAAATELSLRKLTLRGGVGAGAALLVEVDAALTLEEVRLVDNAAGGGAAGGAISLTGAASSLSAKACEFAGNSAGGQGGAIAGAGASLTLIGCTVSGNSAAQGGGLRVSSGALVLRNSTIADNTATGTGGGVDASGAASLTIESSILGDNSDSGAAPDLAEALAETVSASLLESASGHSVADGGGNVVGQDPGLAALADNAGPSRTHAFARVSPAIDAGSNSAGSSTDQRGSGYPRSVGGVDMGAFEASANTAPINTLPASVSTEEEAPFSFGGASAISVVDSETQASALELQVEVAVTQGTLSLSHTSGLTFVTGDGSADASLAFRGTQAALNQALASLSYQPRAGYFGADSLSLTTKDLGNLGGGGAKQDADAVAITVTERPNDPPRVTLDSRYVLTDKERVRPFGALQLSDPDGDELRVELRFDAEQGAFSAESLAAAGVTRPEAGRLERSGPADQVRAALGALVWVPSENRRPPGETEEVSLSLSARDEEFTTARQVRLAVTSVDDPSTLTLPQMLSASPGVEQSFSRSQGNPIVVSDPDRGGEVCVTLSAQGGQVTLARTAGLRFLQGDGSQDELVAFAGSLEAVNAALDGMVLTPASATSQVDLALQAASVGGSAEDSLSLPGASASSSGDGCSLGPPGRPLPAPWWLALALMALLRRRAAELAPAGPARAAR